MINLKIQKALNLDITFQELFIFANNLDILDLHFQIQKIILKSNQYLINNPPPFHKIICLFFIKPEIINVSKLINFYSHSEQILLSYFSFSLNKIIPDFFYNIQPKITQKYISQFPPDFIISIHKNINIHQLASLLDNYKNPIINHLSSNIDPFLFVQLISFINNDFLIEEIKTTNYNDEIIIQLKKHFKTATQYNHIFLIFASYTLINFSDIFIPIFFQQNSQTKHKVCPHLSLITINKILQHLFFINLKDFDLSWLNFSSSQKNIIITYLKNKSQQINKILLSYNIQTIARKYISLKKNITICTSLSNSIPPKNHFKISQKALNNLYKSAAISFIEKNQYIIQ